MNYLSAESISKSYGDRWLFKNLNFGISRGQRLALVGINGSGKSTLLKVLAGIIPPDEGKVSVRKEVRIGYLGQNPEFDEETTIHASLFAMENEVLLAIREYERALQHSAEEPDQLQQAMERMDQLQAWEYEVKVKQILSKLGIDDLDQRIKELSGGQRKRVAMARVLIEDPDLLIFDEPTNHLDLDSIEWLEQYLATQNTTLLMVTHDRYFLDNVTNEILELEQGQLFSYKGNYTYFVEKKAEREAMEMAEVEKARNLMRKELDWMRRQPKARGTKSKSRVEAFYDLKDKAAGKAKGPELELSVKTTRQGNKILEVEHLHKQFGDLVVADDFSYIFRKKDRIGIIGPNGVGKSTFLEMLTGRQQPDSGEIVKGETTVFGYYTQDEFPFQEDQRVLDIVKEVADVVETANGEVITASQFLQLFQFPPAMQYTFVSKLSGGEKRRLQMLRVLIKNPNFLIMDEPTNDLDLITLNTLEEFLDQFGGCLIIVSHDRYFMDRLVDHLFVFEGNGQIRDFPGNYTDFREWHQEREREEREREKQKAEQQEKTKATTEATTANNQKRKASYQEKREYEQLEEEIMMLEEQKENLMEEMNSGITDHTQLTEMGSKLEHINKQLDQKTERWMELSELL